MNGSMSRIRQLCLDQCKTLEADFIITRLIVPNMSFFYFDKTTLSKTSRNIDNFYASWDLLEICTYSNLVALADKLSTDMPESAWTKSQFLLLVDRIYNAICPGNTWKVAGKNYTKRKNNLEFKNLTR